MGARILLLHNASFARDNSDSPMNHISSPRTVRKTKVLHERKPNQRNFINLLPNTTFNQNPDQIKHTAWHDPYTLHPMIRIELYRKISGLQHEVPMLPVILGMGLKNVANVYWGWCLSPCLTNRVVSHWPQKATLHWLSSSCGLILL